VDGKYASNFILNSPHDPVSHPSSFLEKQAKKAIFLGLHKLGPSIFLALFFLISPLHKAEASFFEWITDKLTTNATAAENDNTLNSQTMPLLQAVLNSYSDPSRGGGDIVIVANSALLPESGPSGTSADIEERTNGEISLYVVHKGDTISAIAKMFGVSANTIIWGNDLRTTILKEGQQLVILPISGVRHVVKAGDTVQTIAKKYKGDIKEILQFNDLSESQKLAVGDVVIIPDGEIVTAPVIKKTPSKNLAHDTGGPDYGLFFTKPLASYVRTQGLHGYNGVDLGAPTGSPIYAAAEGDVIIAKNSGWNGGYGEYVVISHANGTQTLYAHASRVAVYEGMHVLRGQVIAYLGSTGKATGPHLHFEVRGAKNPF